MPRILDFFLNLFPAPLQRFELIPVGGWVPRAKNQPPPGFRERLALVEQQLAEVKPFYAPRRCPHCNHQLVGSGYVHRYVYGGWSWSDLDSNHMLFGHVPGDSEYGYFAVPSAFVDLIMQAPVTVTIRAAA